MSTLLQHQSYHNEHFYQIDLYTYGDPEFRPVLIDSMINNLLELQQELYISTMRQDPDIFLRAVHKSKTTLSILDNSELSDVVEELKCLTNRRKRIVIFDVLCSEVIRYLREEKDRTGASLKANK
jgi:hypothetical protein